MLIHNNTYILQAYAKQNLSKDLFFKANTNIKKKEGRSIFKFKEICKSIQYEAKDIVIKN